MKIEIKNIPSFIMSILIIITIEIGLLIRLYIAKVGIGFICDDMLLLQNSIFSYFHLLTQTLDNDQCCPILFVIMLKFLYFHFGANHQILQGGG